jgi:hypothetical protein
MRYIITALGAIILVASGYVLQQGESFLPINDVAGLTQAEIDAKLQIEEQIYAHIDKNGIVDRMAVVDWDFLVANPERYGDSSEWVRASTQATIKKNYPAVGYSYDKTLDAFTVGIDLTWNLFLWRNLAFDTTQIYMNHLWVTALLNDS